MLIGFILGVVTGVVLMCIVQINRKTMQEVTIEERKDEKKFEEMLISKNDLGDKAKLVLLNDLINEYRNEHKNVYTTMRDITNIIKGW